MEIVPSLSFVGTDNLVKMVGELGNGVVISQVVPFPGDMSVPVVKECAELLAKHSPGQTVEFVNLEGCITAKAMVLGLEKAGKDLTRPGLIKAFEGLKGVDIGGLSFTLDAGDHQASKSVFLTQIKGGKITPIAAIEK